MTACDIRLYGILDPEHTRGRDLATLADAAVRGGVTILQLRDKLAGTRLFVERARAVKAALAGRIPLIINDRVDVALAVDAEGVHVGRSDMLPADARGLIGSGKILGLTLKTSAHIAEIDPAIATYGCIGGVFPTYSKDNPDAPVGLDGFRRLRAQAAACGLPIGAIAGITAENASDVIAAGADGIAVISAIFAADDVTAAARHLRVLVDAALDRRRQA